MAALEEYNQTYGNFPYVKCWRVLKDCTKWHTVRPTVGTSSSRAKNTRPSKKSRTSDSVDPETPTSDARYVDLNSPEENPYFAGEEGAEELPRPAGRRAARAARTESSSG